MTFWMSVAATYAMIVVVGLVLGSVLGQRFGRRNGGGGPDAPAPAPDAGPSFALDAVPPLGSDFDRAFLPGAFDPADVAVS